MRFPTVSTCARAFRRAGRPGSTAGEDAHRYGKATRNSAGHDFEFANWKRIHNRRFAAQHARVRFSGRKNFSRLTQAKLQPLGHSRATPILAHETLLFAHRRFHGFNTVGRRGEPAGELALEHRQVV